MEQWPHKCSTILRVLSRGEAAVRKQYPTHLLHLHPVSCAEADLRLIILKEADWDYWYGFWFSGNNSSRIGAVLLIRNKKKYLTRTFSDFVHLAHPHVPTPKTTQPAGRMIPYPAPQLQHHGVGICTDISSGLLQSIGRFPNRALGGNHDE